MLAILDDSMSVLSILTVAGTFFAVVFGLGLPWTCQGSAPSVEKLTKAAVLGLGQLYLSSWIIYIAGWPVYTYTLLPVAAAAGWGIRLRSISRLFAAPDAREASLHLLLLAGWSLAWLATIRSYSGGEWAGDWLEHFQRSLFYLEHQPLDTKFYYHWSLTARPPLVNVITGCFMALFGKDFAVAQVVNTCWSVLVLLPATLILDGIRHDTRCRRVLLVLLMFNPLFIQNATFAWTKLPCAFLVLAAIAVHAPRTAAGQSERWCALAMALAILAHYSAVPYAITLVFLAAFRQAGHRPADHRRRIGSSVTLAILILATWVGWAAIHFGIAGTLFDNSTFQTDAGRSLGHRIWLRWHATWVTLVPHALRSTDYSWITQQSAIGRWRDYLFNIYQTTLPGAVGLGGLVVLVTAPHRRLANTLGRTSQQYWLWTVVVGFALSIATVSWPDRWGIVHIGMSPLVVLALAWAAAMIPDLGKRARVGLTAALLCDFLLGIVLHFWVQATVKVEPDEMLRFLQEKDVVHSAGVLRNGILKFIFHTRFVADAETSPVLIVWLIAAIGILAVSRLWRVTRREPSSPLNIQ